ncbi:MAG: DMT family transporter [Anaerovoracaceae bacterium]
MSKKLKGDLLLLLTAFIWGSAFVAQSAGADLIGPFTFNAVRYLISFLFLVPVIYIMNLNKKKNNEAELTPEAKKLEKSYYIKGGIACGIILCIASGVQQLGIQFTTAGKAGFITSLYVVLVPILGIFIGKKVKPLIWICVIMAAVGLYFLSFKKGDFSISKGDFIILICAVCFSVHILVIDYFSPKTDGVKMSCIQFLVTSLGSAVIMFVRETIVVENIMAAMIPLLYAGVLSGGVGYTLQIVAQKDTEPAIASLILSLESVFAVICGVLLLSEAMTTREIFGCVVMFVAIVLAQLPSKEERLANKA